MTLRLTGTTDPSMTPRCLSCAAPFRRTPLLPVRCCAMMAVALPPCCVTSYTMSRAASGLDDCQPCCRYGTITTEPQSGCQSGSTGCRRVLAHRRVAAACCLHENDAHLPRGMGFGQGWSEEGRGGGDMEEFWQSVQLSSIYICFMRCVVTWFLPASRCPTSLPVV